MRDDDDDGFNDFLQDVIDCGGLEQAAAGITKLVMDKGKEALSPKQAEVFKRYVLDEYVVGDCKRCGCDTIPWCEAMQAYHNGGYCSWCEHMMNKED